MTSEALRVEHIAQPAVLVDDLDAALDWISAVFKAYPSERVDITGAGVNNAVYAFANRTYLELIEPYNPQSGAYRLLERFGPGWHMLNVDIVDTESADIEDALTGARCPHRPKKQDSPRQGSVAPSPKRYPRGASESRQPGRPRRAWYVGRLGLARIRLDKHPRRARHRRRVTDNGRSPSHWATLCRARVRVRQPFHGRTGRGRPSHLPRRIVSSNARASLKRFTGSGAATLTRSRSLSPMLALHGSRAGTGNLGRRRRRVRPRGQKRVLDRRQKHRHQGGNGVQRTELK